MEGRRGIIPEYKTLNYAHAGLLVLTYWLV